MAQPKWLRGSRKSWERIGFLKLAAISISRSGSADDLVDRMRRYLNSPARVPYDLRFVEWLSSNGLLNRQELERIASEHNVVDIRRQYWWTYQTATKAGWLSREAIPEYFESFPRKTGMLEDNFDLSELGRTLVLGFVSTDEVDAWEGRAILEVSPLTLTPGQKVFFVYSILKSDGDFMLPLLEQWVESFGSTTFTYLDAGAAIPLALDNMAAHFKGSAYSTDDQREISEIERVRDLISAQIETKIEKKGSGSRREQMSIPRLEWLVDFGVLQKENTRDYKFTEQGLSLAKELTAYYRNLLSHYYAEDCLGRLLNQQFFGPTMRFLCGDAKKAAPLECLKLLREAYKVVRSSLGYVLIRSLLLLIHGRQAETGTPSFIEYDDTLQAIEAEYQANPLAIYYTVDRLGNEYQVKFAA